MTQYPLSNIEHSYNQQQLFVQYRSSTNYQPLHISHENPANQEV